MVIHFRIRISTAYHSYHIGGIVPDREYRTAGVSFLHALVHHDAAARIESVARHFQLVVDRVDIAFAVTDAFAFWETEHMH